MATNRGHIGVSPERVWDVLSDPYLYPEWVVGSKETVTADPNWPAAGADFKVKVGVGPLSYTDRTKCESQNSPHRLVLIAGGGGVAGARVEIRLEPDGDGTQVTLVETPEIHALRLIPPVHWAIKARNVESMRRLKRLAEQGPAKRQG
jgi:carbon monoxide dehydrogenase subunit G